MAWHSGKPADSDFLSASVRHIRENFAELEPLQPHVAELVDLTALHPYIDALLSSRIVEMGSNSNGTYVRWENGLQICYVFRGNLGVTPNTGSIQGLTLYWVAAVWNYPAAFSVVPSVSIFGRPITSESLEIATLRDNPTTTQASFTLEALFSYSACRFSGIAIGRWK